MVGVAGPLQLNLGGLGIRGCKWCPQLGLNGLYLILAGTASGGPVVLENAKSKSSVYSWTGLSTDTPQKLIDDCAPYTTRPEGVDLIQVQGKWRIIFVEDRYQATGYGTRNAIHWPLDILGQLN